jgi:hypothetical protein
MTRSPAQLGKRRCHWPTWLVSAKHRTVIMRDGESEWSPLGEHHARQSGENLTACGLVAIGWPVFWLMPFEPEASTSCPNCVAAVTSAAASTHRERPGCC